MKVFFKTFGCRSNIFDTELMRNILKDKVSLVDNESDADLVIVNSCTVTNFADRDLRSYINKLKTDVILTGCGAYTQGEKPFKEKILSEI